MKDKIGIPGRVGRFKPDVVFKVFGATRWMEWQLYWSADYESLVWAALLEKAEIWWSR